MTVETRISTWRFAELAEDMSDDLKTSTKEFARKIELNHEFNYYAIYWDQEEYFLATMKYPSILKTLTKV